jgi:hypothetical protein
MRNDDHVARAFRAYEIRCAREGHLYQQPANDSGVVVHEGRRYVELPNGNGTLAVYRVKPDGTLRHLRRWPKAVEVE